MPMITDRNQTPDLDNAPRFELSLRQMIASTGAAVTAAVLGSRLGVAGTLIGAALASIVSMGAAAIYGHSLEKAQYKVRQKLTAGQSAELDAAEAPTTVLPVTEQAWGRLSPSHSTAAVLAAPSTARTNPRRPRQNWLWAGLGALAACVIALGAITGFEAVRGAPISGGDQGGLSVLGGAPARPVESTTPDSPSTPSSTRSTSTPDSTSSTPSETSSPDPSATSPTPTTVVTTTVTQTVLPPVGAATGSPDPSTSAPSTAGDGLAGTTTSSTPTTAAAVRPGGQ